MVEAVPPSPARSGRIKGRTAAAAVGDGAGRRLACVPGPDAAVAVPREAGLPVVTIDALPGGVHPGGDAEVLVLAANPLATTLPEVWIGLVLPPGARMSSVTPPAGTVAVTELAGLREVVRARLGPLEPGACVGLDVSLTVADVAGPHHVTAFVTACCAPQYAVTCEHVLEAPRTA